MSPERDIIGATGPDPGRNSVPHSIDAAFAALPLRALADAALARARPARAAQSDVRLVARHP
ncbi:hypothetical protein ACFXPJ_36200, partial [Streptomyces goshikiensis]